MGCMNSETQDPTSGGEGEEKSRLQKIVEFCLTYDFLGLFALLGGLALLSATVVGYIADLVRKQKR